MSIRLDAILEPLYQRVTLSTYPESIKIETHPQEEIDASAAADTALETQRLFRQTMQEYKAHLPLIKKIIDTSDELLDEQIRINSWRFTLNLLTAATSGFCAGFARCILLPECPSVPTSKEEDRISRAAFVTTVGIVAATSIQLIKNTLFPTDQSERKQAIKNLWMQLDGEIPPNLLRACNDLYFQVMEASKTLQNIGKAVAPTQHSQFRELFSLSASV